MALTAAEKQELKRLEEIDEIRRLEKEVERQQAAKPKPAPKKTATEPAPGLLQRVGQGIERGLTILGKPADFVNAAVGTLAQENRRNQLEMERIGREEQRLPTLGELVGGLPRAVGRAYEAGSQAFTDTSRATPPSLIRGSYGMERGKTPAPIYNAASIADYLLGAATDPTNLIAPGASLANTAKKVPGVTKAVSGVRKGVETAGQAAAATRAGQAVSRGFSTLDQWVNQLAKSENPWTKFVSLQKQAWLSNPGTQFSNLTGNLVMSELALKRAGVPVAKLGAGYKAGGKELYAHLRHGRTSADIAELSRLVPDFAEGLAGTVKTGGALDRLTDWNLFMQFQSKNDMLGKLSLYKSLKAGGKSPEEAAAMVKRMLFDYGDRPALVEFVDRWGLAPFATFGWKAMEALAETMVHQPWLIQRYPRLKAMLEEDNPGSREARENLAPWDRGMMTLPTGSDSFVNLVRAHPLAESMGLFDEKDTGRGKPDFKTNLKGFIERPAVAGYLIRAYNRVPDNIPAEEQARIFWREVWNSALPLTRTTGVPAMFPGAVGSAMQGRATSDYYLNEPQSVGQSLLQSLAGVRTMKGEPEDVKRDRLKPTIKLRELAAKAFIGELDREAEEKGNPYTSEVSRITDRRTVDKKLGATQAYLRKLLNNPRLISDKGELSNEGRYAIRRAHLYSEALRSRGRKLAAP